MSYLTVEVEIAGNRLLLAGDAAGLINPLSGDGIQYALLSARWAADTLETCLQKNDFSATALYAYRKTIDKELSYDFALSNLLVQFPRNKTFTPVWMTMLKIMVSRAKEDKNYADIIAGIFEGTYPSHKALTPSFIIKSLLQGGKEMGKTLTGYANNPAAMMDSGLTFSQSALQMLEGVKDYPGEHGRWMLNTVSKTIEVAGHVIQNITRKE